MAAAAMRQLYVTTLSRAFPPVEFAFAYGSAVFQQRGRAMGKMLDLVFAVRDPESWHEENMDRNPAHYSALRWLGPRTVARVQRAPAGVYYNTLVTVGSQLLKYGVISMEDLLTDLQHWKWLYISGRLHKPVLFMSTPEEGSELKNALQINLRTAVLCAALLMGRRGFTAEELFLKITGLSFMGDFRMLIGEDKNKITNIVGPNIEHFHSLYKTHMSHLLEPLTHSADLLQLKDAWESPDQLPQFVRNHLDRGLPLDKAIANIVGASSTCQSLKGILTAGPVKTTVYSYGKIQKMFKSMQRQK